MNMTEGSTIEFKRIYVNDIAKTAVAFANTKGGRIYIGIEDDGTVAGIDDADDVMLKCTNNLRDSIKPDITLIISTL